MTNIINFKDYKQSSRPKKRMIDADVLLETIEEYISRADIDPQEKRTLIGLHLFLDIYADINK